MTFKKIQDIVLNKLLDKYEKSKTFIGANQVNQNFTKKISEIFRSATKPLCSNFVSGRHS